EQHEAVRRRVDLVAHAVAHARRARGPTLEVVGRVARDLALRTLVRLPRLAAVPVHGRGRVRLGDLHAAALARLAGSDDPGQDAERAEQRARVDAHRRVLGDIGEPLLVDARVHQAGPGVVGDAVAGHVLVRAGHAVARDGDEHERGVHLAQRLVAHAAAGGGRAAA